MGIDSTNSGSGSGDGRGPFDEATNWSDDDGPLHDAIGRLVTVMLREALESRSSEIQIGVGEDGYAVHFVQGLKKLAMDALPVRLFGPLKDRVARMCGKEDCQGHGTFSALLKRTETSAKGYGEVNVAVVFGDSSLQLTIADFKRSSP